MNEPALLDPHQQHTQLPEHVRDVMQGEFMHSFFGAVFSIRRVHENHVEVNEDNELNWRQNHGGFLEVGVLGVGLRSDAKVMANHKEAARKGVKHDDQCCNSLRWIEVQQGAGVVEAEELVNERLRRIEVAWSSVKELVPKRAGILLNGKVHRICRNK